MIVLFPNKQIWSLRKRWPESGKRKRGVISELVQALVSILSGRTASICLRLKKRLVMSTRFSGYLVYDEYFTLGPPLNPTMTLWVGPIIILTVHFGTKKLNYLPTVTWVTSGPKSNQVLSSCHAPLHFLVCWCLRRSS